MGEYFKGWRRKIGVITLLFACLFTDAWMRGHIVEDCFGWGDDILENGRGECHVLCASRNGLIWKKFETLHPSLIVEMGEANIRWSRKPITASASADPRAHLTFDSEMEWRWWGGGFDLGVLHEKWNIFLRVKFAAVSYWSIILVLTILSSCLLLSKPRPKSSMRTSDPKPIEAP